MWQGVERVVVTCEFDSSVQPALRPSFCRQILAEARKLTAYPVSLAQPADLAGSLRASPDQRKQLLLKVQGRLAGGTGAQSALILTVQPARLGMRGFQARQMRPMPVALAWSRGMPRVQGPVRPLQLLLSEPRRPGGDRPPFPVRSDGR